MNKIKGIWVVYDLEANRKIQKILITKYKFDFHPSLDVFIRNNDLKKRIKLLEKRKWI